MALPYVKTRTKQTKDASVLQKIKKGGRQFLTSSFPARQLGPGACGVGGGPGAVNWVKKRRGETSFLPPFFFFFLMLFFVTFFIDLLLIPPSSDTSSPPVGSSAPLKLEKSTPSFVPPQTCRPPFCPWTVAFFVYPVGCFVSLPHCPLSPGDRRLSNCHSGCMSVVVYWFTSFFCGVTLCLSFFFSRCSL